MKLICQGEIAYRTDNEGFVCATWTPIENMFFPSHWVEIGDKPPTDEALTNYLKDMQENYARKI